VSQQGERSVFIGCPPDVSLLVMPFTVPFHESRRSTRVPLKVVITVVEGGAESLTCKGETIIVNLHGALIPTALWLSLGMRISIHVYLTNKRAAARVVYTDPNNPRHCGIALDEPRNIWGVSLPPDDWDETSVLETEH
jgi:PilZ domain-containing protein